MTYKIRGNPDYLIKQSGRLNDLAAAIDRDLRQLDDAVRPLRNTFLGQRASSFFQQYDQFRGQMFSLRDIARNFSGQLADAGRKFKAADRS